MIAGRYTLGREIGRGGMGAVWLGTDEVLGRPVALKRIGLLPGVDGTDLARAEREARLAARLNHPHVVAVFNVVADDDSDARWLVMEYVEGSTLGQLVRQRGRLGPVEAAELLAQAADALVAAHAAGIVHRDVKPSNILVGRGGTVKLTDFGIARITADPSLTQTGLVTGSPAYLAPEVAAGQRGDEAVDAWSLGATLFHALSGRPPYEMGDNVLGGLYRLVHEEPPRLPDAGPLAPLLAGTLVKNPADRWSMRQARDFLAGVAAGTSPTAPAPPAAPPGGGAAGGPPGDPDTRTLDAAPGPAAGSPAAAPAPGRAAAGAGAAPAAGRAASGAGAAAPAAGGEAAGGEAAGGEAASGAAAGGAAPGGAAAGGAASGAATPGTPAPVAPAPRAETSRAAGRPRLSRPVLVAAVIGLVAAVALGLVAVLRDGDTGTPAQAPAGSTSAQPSEEPSETAGPPTAADMDAFVRDYVAAVSTDPDEAWTMLTPKFQRESGGLQTYREFWSGVGRGRILDISADPDSLVVSYRVRFENFGTGQRPTVLELAYDEGRYLIDGELTEGFNPSD